MTKLFLLSITFALVACHAVPQTAATPSKRVLGTFAYKANLGERNELGTFTIEADTVLVDADQANCRRDVSHSVAERIHNFDCVGAEGTNSLSLTIDSSRPFLSTWYATRTVSKTRRICTQYATKATGETYCATYGTEKYDATEPIYGPLRVTAVKAN